MRSRHVVAVVMTAAAVLSGTATTADAAAPASRAADPLVARASRAADPLVARASRAADPLVARASRAADPLVARASRAADPLVASWRMNESAGSRTMIDSSGHGLRGTIGREVDTGILAGGATAYRFERLEPDTPPARPQHLVTVPDSALLDPGTRDYAVTLRLRTTHKFGNIIQKGQATVSGGNFKMQIPNGIVQCLFRGSSGSRLISTPRRLNDGRWHTVRCARTGSGISLAVDGVTVARRSGWTGRISNSWPLTIGGKSGCDQIEVGCDYYAGDLDWVEITAG